MQGEEEYFVRRAWKRVGERLVGGVSKGALGGEERGVEWLGGEQGSWEEVSVGTREGERVRASR